MKRNKWKMTSHQLHSYRVFTEYLQKSIIKNKNVSGYFFLVLYFKKGLRGWNWLPSLSYTSQKLCNLQAFKDRLQIFLLILIINILLFEFN